jgi:lysylphosphatidylglycerol synthetase-like protein (DUF2156 family)
VNGIVALLLWRTLRPSSAERARGHLNWPAASFMAAALICLLLPLSLGATWGWGSARALGVFAAAAVLATAWVRIELRSQTPLIDMRVMRLPAVWTANLASLLFGVGLYSAIGYLPSFLQAPRPFRLRVRRLDHHLRLPHPSADARHAAHGLTRSQRKS